ncbi:MAG: fibronectin, partial [Candidatus Marinimicrobia bacterium]|nr:fibronectin [Candidatus Neomarinimicrobiota bacterium]
MNRQRNFIIFFILIELLIAHNLFGQVPPEMKKWIKIGYLHHYYSARGGEWGWNDNTNLFDGLRWPANYYNQDNFCIIRTWLVCRDFTDENGINWSYKSAFMGGMEPGSSVPIVHKMISRFQPPLVYVDGQLSSELVTGIDEIDPNLPCDRKITNIVRTPLGITMTRNIYAFSQQYHSNYFIIEYFLENTGNINNDDEIELQGQTINDLYLGWLDHYANLEASWYVKGDHSWGKFLWVTQRGENYSDWVNGDLAADSMRCNWAWLGKVEGLGWNNIGAPWIRGSGRLTNAQHVGMIFLHVDTGPDDQTDNQNLPVMGWNGNDTHPASANNGTDVGGMHILWDMFAGNALPENGQYGGYDRMDERGTDYPAKIADAGGASSLAGFGPYTLIPGQSVRIVVAEGVSGISRELCENIGHNWKYGNPPFELPDGSTTNSADEY